MNNAGSRAAAFARADGAFAPIAATVSIATFAAIARCAVLGGLAGLLLLPPAAARAQVADPSQPDLSPVEAAHYPILKRPPAKVGPTTTGRQTATGTTGLSPIPLSGTAGATRASAGVTPAATPNTGGATSSVLGPIVPARSGPMNLTRGLPVQTEDADPVGAGETLFQVSPRYDRTSGGRDQWVYTPALQLGLRRDYQLTLAPRFTSGLGGGPRSGNGDVDVSLLRRVSRETDYSTAAAILGRARLPSGEGSQGVDAELTFVVTRSLVPRDRPLTGDPGDPRIHFNVGYLRNGQRARGEQTDGYLALLGYSRQFAPETALAFNVYRRRDPNSPRDTDFAEAGVIRSVRQGTQLALGVGTGLNEGATRLRLTFALQQRL